MNKTLDKKLCDKYPELFRDRYADMTQTAMCWGFECDEGWFNLIDKLCAEIMETCGKTVPIVTQVKEKYGTLRFYIDSGNKAVFEAISKAEDLSGLTCEKCGAEGQLRGVSWVKTLCDKDAEVWEKERQKKGLPI